MSLRIRLACQHPTLVLPDSLDGTPVCPVCGETRVQSVVADRAPRFKGSVLGPCAAYDPTGGAVVVNVAPGGALHLKESL